MLFKTLYTLVLCSFILSISAREQPDTLNMDEINMMLKKFREQKDNNNTAKTYVLRAENYVDKSLQSDEILSDLDLAMEYYRFDKDSIGLFETKLAFARIHMLSENYLNKALEETKEALAFFESKNDVLNQAKSHVLMGQIFEKQLEYGHAVDQLNIADSLNRQSNNPSLKLENGLILTRLLSLQSKAEEAILLNTENLEHAYALKDPLLIFDHLVAIGTDYFKIEENEDALLYFQKADSLQIQDTASKIDLLKLLSALHYEEEQFELAYSYQKRYIQLSDKLNDNQKKALEKQLIVLSKESENEREITSLTIENTATKQKFVKSNAWNMILLFSVLAICDIAFFKVMCMLIKSFLC